MAIYNKGTIKPRPLAGTAASSAQQLATQVAKKQASGPVPNGPLDTTGRQSIRGPADGPLRAPAGLPATSGGPLSPNDPRGQPAPDLKGVALPRPGAVRVQGDTSTLSDVRSPVGPRDPRSPPTGGTKDVTLPPPSDGSPPPAAPEPAQLTEQEMVDAAVRKLLEDQSVNTEKERAAMQGEMKAAEARDIQSMRARTGLGGMGLTGAAGAMESQVRTEGARKQALTTAEFDRQARQEELSRTIAGIEAKFGKDAAARASEAFGIEKELATEELGVMRSMFPEGPAGDAEFDKAKKLAKIKEVQDRKTGAAGAAKAGTLTDMPVGATNKEVEKYVKALPDRVRGVNMTGQGDPLVSGPHKEYGKTYYVYRRQDNNELYKSQDDSGTAGKGIIRKADGSYTYN